MLCGTAGTGFELHGALDQVQKETFDRVKQRNPQVLEEQDEED